MPKFNSLYELGVREFGIFMDDITIGEGLQQRYTQPYRSTRSSGVCMKPTTPRTRRRG